MSAFELDLTEPSALQRAAGNLPHGGLFVPATTPPPALSMVILSVSFPSGEPQYADGRVVTIMGDGFFVQLTRPEQVDALRRRVDDALAQPDDEKPRHAGQKAPLAGAIRPAWELLDMGSSVPLHQQLKDLTVAERLKLARVATRPVRAILIRDNEKRIHLAVVKNPKVTLDEIREWTSLPGIAPGALKWIARQAEFCRNNQIQLNMVKNPGCPQDVAMKMMSLLPISEVLKISRSSMVRQSIQRAAKKKVMDKGLV